MRLTLRVILATMAALESSLDEVCNQLRDPQTGYDLAMHNGTLSSRVALRTARQTLARVLDDMIDSGKGN
jgi:hypothetical protein